MMVDTTVYGYITDGAAYCMGCITQGLDRGRPINMGEAPGPIYYLDDDGRGLTCDGCFEYIFEPSCPECGGTDDQGEAELCPTCAEQAEEDAQGLHDDGQGLQSDSVRGVTEEYAAHVADRLEALDDGRKER